jgi:tetratricopeptide (TPR) repeat protein
MSTNGQDPEEDQDEEQPNRDFIDEEDPDELGDQARAALEAGDHAEALRLMGHALYQSADDEGLHRLLEDIVRDFSGDALELLPDGEVDATVHALRAWLLARRGELSEAIDRLLVQHAVDPQDPYLGWAVRWLRAPGAVESIEVEPIARRLAAIADQLPLDVDQFERERIAEFVPVSDALLARHPRHPRLACAAACILRKIGELERARELAESAVKLDPSFSSFVCLARVEGSLGDLAAARTSYESARELAREETERLRAQAELGALLCAQAETGSGLALLREVLGRDPGQELAFLALNYHEALRDDDEARFAEVEQYAEGHPDSSLARDYLDRFRADLLYPVRSPEVDETFVSGAREAIDELRSHDPDCEEFGAASHRYVLAPPLSRDLIDEIERTHGVGLPVDYVAFVTAVGAHGAGPGYGLLSLDLPGQLTLLDGEFPHRRPVRPTGKQLAPGKLETLGKPLGGVVALAHQGCDYLSFLVIRGPRAGSVWMDLRAAGLGLVPTHDTFNDWYRYWLRATDGGEWPELPVEPGTCAFFRLITSHLHAAEEKLGLVPGSLTEEQTREALATLPSGTVGAVARRSFYYDEGDGIPPCPVCEHMLGYFVEHRLLRPEQIRPGLAPRIARR